MKRTMCCMMYSPSHQALADVTWPNLREYCKIHGYVPAKIGVQNDKWEYKKHEFFKSVFQDMEEIGLIWYRDVDSVITDLTKPITDFIDDEHSFFITEDAMELNGGSVIIKNNGFGIAFNNAVLRQRDLFQNEQNVYNSFRSLYHPYLIKVLPHPSINSYDYSLYPEYPNIRSREQGHWHDGDFVLHTPGLPFEKRIEILKNVKIKR